MASSVVDKHGSPKQEESDKKRTLKEGHKKQVNNKPQSHKKGASRRK